MYEILKPHVEKLLSHREEETVTQRERKRASEVRNMMIEASKLLSKYSTSTSRLSEKPGRKNSEMNPVESETLQTHEKKLPQKEPRTPPPVGAIGKLRRLARMPEWE